MPQLGQLYTESDPLTKSMGSLYLKIAAGVRSGGMMSPGQMDPVTGQQQMYDEPGMLQRGRDIYGPRAQERGQQNVEAGSWAQTFGLSPGMPPEYYRGRGSPFSFAMQGLSAVSPELAILGSFAPMLLPKSVTDSELWRNFTKQQTMYYAGGNPEKIQAVQAAMSKLQAVAADDINKSLRTHVVQAAGMLPDSLLDKMVEYGIKAHPEALNDINSLLGHVGGKIDVNNKEQMAAVLPLIRETLRKNPAAAEKMLGNFNLGPIVQQIYPALPAEAQQAMQLLLPRVAISMQPIANAVSMATGGDPSPEKIEQFANSFSGWYEQQVAPGGALYRDGAVVPKMQAMEVFSFATRFAPNLSQEGLSTLTNQALKLQESAGLPSLGNSLVVLQQMGAEKYANNPKQFDAYINKKLSDLKASGVDIKQLGATAELAMKSGQNVHTIMDSQANTARVGQALAKLPNGNVLANQWAAAAQRLTTSKTGALFAAALASPRLGDMARKARETGDPALMQKVLAAARRDMPTMQMSRRMGQDDVSAALTGNATSALMTAGALMMAKRMGVTARDLRLMRDPQFVQDMMTGDKSVRGQLSQQAQRFLQATNKSGMVAILAHDLTSKKFKEVKPGFVNQKPLQQTAPKQQEAAQPSTAAKQVDEARKNAPTGKPPEAAQAAPGQPAAPKEESPEAPAAPEPPASAPTSPAPAEAPPTAPTPATAPTEDAGEASKPAAPVKPAKLPSFSAAAGAVLNSLPGIGALGTAYNAAKGMFGK